MRMYDIIHKKREGGVLSYEELAFFIRGVTDGSIPDYQIAALLMAIYFRSMTPQETADLTMLMAASGDQVDLSPIEGVKVDKHSTGGVGDKTTLIVAPLVAACGVRVAKMSGRGLGHTGGTVDKLESIPGFQTSLVKERFFEAVREVGVAVIGQTGNLAPADKKLYSLRDVTATVDSIPLIASSIMSKKMAAGADAIVLDVKTGSGAFMKTVEESIVLAQMMVEIGERLGRRTVALITDMGRPLGTAVGNAVEVAEAVDTLRGNGPADLTQISLELAANMLCLAGCGEIGECRLTARRVLESGVGFDHFCRMVLAQGGDCSCLENTKLLPKAKYSREIYTPCGGYLAGMDVEQIGAVSVMLGAGREVKEALIDSAAGILFPVKPGQKLCKGETIAVLLTNDESVLDAAQAKLLSALQFSDLPSKAAPLLHARVHKGGIDRF